MKTKNNLGLRLKQVRTHFRYSQDEFRKKLDVSQFTLSNYESGKRFPDSRFLLKLKNMTNVDLNWLIMGDNTVGNFVPDMIVDMEKTDFFYWFARLPILSHSALASLEELKLKYPSLFKKENEMLTEKKG